MLAVFVAVLVGHCHLWIGVSIWECVIIILFFCLTFITLILSVASLVRPLQSGFNIGFSVAGKSSFEIYCVPFFRDFINLVHSYNFLVTV